jgi:hypothetical protein
MALDGCQNVPKEAHDRFGATISFCRKQMIVGFEDTFTDGKDFVNFLNQVRGRRAARSDMQA